MAIRIRHIYDELQDEISQEAGLDCSNDPGRTKQSDKDACDINLITKRYERTGTLPDLIQREPRYGDFSAVPDFQAALDLVHLAEAQFGALDAHIRTRFANDPANFLAFATNPANLDEMVKLGLATKKADPTPSPAASASAVAPAAVAAQGAK